MVRSHRGETWHADEGHRRGRPTLRGAVRLTHFCDANLFVYAALSREAEGEEARAALRHLRQGGWDGATSPLVIDEVLWSLSKNKSKDLALETAERIYTIPHLSVVGISAQAPQRAFRFVRDHGLKPRDALHVATMLEAGLSTIVSTDPDFDKVREIRRLEPAAAARRK